MRIDGECLPGRFDYSFGVNGAIEGRHLNSDDTLSQDGADGQVSGYDEYRFIGDLETISLGGWTVVDIDR